jgi:membrane protein implicated in regulation of membrane protease activity
VALKFVNAFWISGIFLDVIGAVLATLTARWFELLDEDECDHLAVHLATPSKSSPTWTRSYIIATALFSPMPVVAVGVALLLIGLVVYVWAAQPLLVSVTSTLTFAILAPFVAIYFIPHADRKKDIIECLGRKRGAW